MEDIKLSSTDAKILRGVSEHGAVGQDRITVQNLAEYAGVSPETLYKKLRDPQFRSLFIESMRTSLISETPGILKVFLEKAKEGSFKHGKLILEVAGVYTEEKNIKLDAKVEEKSSPFKTEEEKKGFIQSLTGRILGKSSEITEEGE